jgi:hypothetical protein
VLPPLLLLPPPVLTGSLPAAGTAPSGGVAPCLPDAGFPAFFPPRAAADAEGDGTLVAANASPPRA